MRLRLPAGSAVEWSDHLEALVRIELAPGLTNPGGYDTRVALDAAAITASGRAANPLSMGCRQWPGG